MRTVGSAIWTMCPRIHDVPRRYWLTVGISKGHKHGTLHAAAAVVWRVHEGKFPVDFDIETVLR
jgi:hypothetical protein